MSIVRQVVPMMEAVHNYQWGSNNKTGTFYPDEAAFSQDLADGTLWVVEDTEASIVVGVAALTVDQPDEYGEAGLDLSLPAVVPHRLAVLPQSQGRGVARLLYSKAEDLAREVGWNRVRVDTCTLNGPMNSLIQSLGYSPAKRDFTFPGKADGLRFCAYEKELVAGK
jgi:GNAT superfamily N-acetyltransferase